MDNKLIIVTTNVGILEMLRSWKLKTDLSLAVCKSATSGSFSFDFEEKFKNMKYKQDQMSGFKVINSFSLVKIKKSIDSLFIIYNYNLFFSDNENISM